jgi:23S rRNA (adenine2503-C2)-methyltransferase
MIAIEKDIAVKKDIRLLTREQLEEVVLGLGEKKFRAAQIYEWLWQR